MEENDQMLECSGFEVVREGRRPFFRTPKPHRRQLHKMTEVRAYLEAEHIGGRLLNVHPEQFNFASRKRKKQQLVGQQMEAILTMKALQIYLKLIMTKTYCFDLLEEPTYHDRW